MAGERGWVTFLGLQLQFPCFLSVGLTSLFRWNFLRFGRREDGHVASGGVRRKLHAGGCNLEQSTKELVECGGAEGPVSTPYASVRMVPWSKARDARCWNLERRRWRKTSAGQAASAEGKWLGDVLGPIVLNDHVYRCTVRFFLLCIKFSKALPCLISTIPEEYKEQIHSPLRPHARVHKFWCHCEKYKVGILRLTIWDPSMQFSVCVVALEVRWVSMESKGQGPSLSLSFSLSGAKS